MSGLTGEAIDAMKTRSPRLLAQVLEEKKKKNDET